MAFFWVGGNGVWSGADATHWAASSGGAGGAGVPTAADDVHFDTNSTTSVVTITGTAACRDLICEGTFTGRFAGTGTLAIAGSLTYRAGMGTNTNSGTFTFTATTGGHTITSAGNVLPSLTFDGVGGAWSLADALSASNKTITVTNGAFSTNNQNMSIGALSSNNSNVRSISLGSSAITLTGGVGTCLQFGTVAAGIANLTWSAGTSVITLNTTGSTNYNLLMNTLQQNNIVIAGQGTGSVLIGSSSGDITIASLSYTGTNAKTFQFNSTRTYNVGAWGITGRSGVNLSLTATTPGSAYILNYTGVGVLSLINLIVQDSTATPSATWFDRGLPVATMNVSGNTGWVFSARRILTATRAVASTRTPIASTRAVATTRTPVG